MNTNASTPASKRRRVHLGNFTYTPLPEGAEFRPSLRVLLAAVLFCGASALVSGYIVLFVVAPLSQGRMGGLWYSAAEDMILGGFATLMVVMVVYQIWFWCHPTAFDYAGGVFRRGDGKCAV